MRRFLCVGIWILLFTFVAVSSNAASIGGPDTQGKGKFSLGLDQDYVFNRDLKASSSSIDTVVATQATDGSVKISGLINCKTKLENMYRTMVKASYGLLNNLDVYLKLGTAAGQGKNSYSGSVDFLDPYSLNTGTASIGGGSKLKTSNAFAYGFGLKGKYDLPHGWFVGADAQYLRHTNSYTSSGSLMLTDNETSESVSSDFSSKGRLVIQEWQFAPYIAKKIKNFTPYLGVKYSDFRVNDVGSGTSRAKNNFGVFGGLSYKLKDHISLNLEGRFIDETAMTCSIGYKF